MQNNFASSAKLIYSNRTGSVKTTAHDQNNNIQWYFDIFKAQKSKVQSPAKQLKELFSLCPSHFW